MFYVSNIMNHQKGIRPFKAHDFPQSIYRFSFCVEKDPNHKFIIICRGKWVVEVKSFFSLFVFHENVLKMRESKSLTNSFSISFPSRY